MRILIVEDEKILAGQLAEQLRLSGFVTDLCHDGNEAGFLGETEPYDAIILDLGLPGRDGLSVLKEWRSKGMDTPVLVLTARGQLHEKIEGLNAGADDYLTKPFQVAELVARVQALRCPPAEWPAATTGRLKRRHRAAAACCSSQTMWPRWTCGQRS